MPSQFQCRKSDQVQTPFLLFWHCSGGRQATRCSSQSKPRQPHLNAAAETQAAPEPTPITRTPSRAILVSGCNANEESVRLFKSYLRKRENSVKTIHVEIDREAKPQPGTTALRCLSIYDLKSIRAAWDPWYPAKLAEIHPAMESDESRRLADKIKKLEDLLKPTVSDFATDARFRQLLERNLVGRTWLVVPVEKWRCGKRDVPSVLGEEWVDLRGESLSRMLWLMGAPGVGGSAFAAHLAHELWPGHGHRSPVLRLEETGSPRRQLHQPHPAFQTATRLPDWIRLVVTSRTQFDVTTPLHALKPFPFDTKSAANSDDIHASIRCALAAQFQNRPDVNPLVEQIQEKSEGVFLYVESFCEDIVNNNSRQNKTPCLLKPHATNTTNEN